MTDQEKTRRQKNVRQKNNTARLILAQSTQHIVAAEIGIAKAVDGMSHGSAQGHQQAIVRDFLKADRLSHLKI